jgi:hypothetical protein
MRMKALGYAIALYLLILGSFCDAQDNRFADKPIVRAADQITAHQMPDGAIVMGALPAAESRVLPYFANFAALGMVAAYRETRQPRYLEVARRWVGWYEAHQNPDGTINDYTGTPGAWKSTGDYDSTDSYAATYLELLLAIYRATTDGKWLRAQYPSATHAIAAIRLTLQPSGLTIAKPTYPVMYTMDNVETVRGLHAAAAICRIVDDKTAASATAALATGMEAALTRDLWDPVRQCYRIGVQTDGFKAEGLKVWYPDAMANLMVVGWRPRSARNRALFARLKAQFSDTLPTVIRNEDDLDHLCWWGWGARGAEDAALSAQIAARLSAFDIALPAVVNPGLLGHLCRLLSRRED